MFQAKNMEHSLMSPYLLDVSSADGLVCQSDHKHKCRLQFWCKGRVNRYETFLDHRCMMQNEVFRRLNSANRDHLVQLFSLLVAQDSAILHDERFRAISFARS